MRHAHSSQCTRDRSSVVAFFCSKVATASNWPRLAKYTHPASQICLSPLWVISGDGQKASRDEHSIECGCRIFRSARTRAGVDASDAAFLVVGATGVVGVSLDLYRALG